MFRWLNRPMTPVLNRSSHSIPRHSEAHPMHRGWSAIGSPPPGKSQCLIGKPSISMGHGFHGELLNNQRVLLGDVRWYLDLWKLILSKSPIPSVVQELVNVIQTSPNGGIISIRNTWWCSQIFDPESRHFFETHGIHWYPIDFRGL